jgi:sterol desaturase/sphingolipid hydroxylase (fatty acid hydroxylase superfamily)
MEKYKDIIINSYTGYFNYLKNEVLTLHVENYFYGLIIISLLVFILEIIFPWRKNQPIIRKDFWLDLFYMFFNFFLLNLIVLIALSNVTEQLFNDFLSKFNLQLVSLQLINIGKYPKVVSLLLFFIISDFIQWNTHRMLHRVSFFWNFHKVHHSVKQMGFAAHLRYHWMEPVIYKSMLYIPMAIIGGFSIQDVFIVHFFAISIGHLNHANLGWDYGFLKYIFNNPKMHIWHHSKQMPNKYGMNFGITLSLWDYIFKTNYVPRDGRDIELGFENDEQFPNNFINQESYPLKF